MGRLIRTNQEMENHAVLSLRTIPQINVPFSVIKSASFGKEIHVVLTTLSCKFWGSFFVIRLIIEATVKLTAYQISTV